MSYGRGGSNPPSRTEKGCASFKRYSPAMSEFSQELSFALEIAREAAEPAAQRFGGRIDRSRKADGTWVTEADKEAERTLRARIAQRFPDHNIHGEEEGLRSASGGDPTEGAPTWVLDPIDGTNNFMSGIPIWATLVGLRHGDISVLGVAHAPALGETYDAATGMGARRNGEAIHVDDLADLSDATALFASVQSFNEEGMARFFKRLTDSTWRSRGLGDFWGHMLVARGAAQIMVEPSLKLWDFAPLEPIVREAGGKITNLEGGPCTDESSCLSTNGHLHDAVLQLVG